MLPTTLFNNSSITGTSLVNFTIDNQVTVAAIGLPAGATVTFEMVQLNTPGREAMGNGNCCEIPADIMPHELAWQPLMCCEGQPVRVNAANPFIVLDAPQHVRLRALLTGFDFSAGPFTGDVIVYPSTSTITSDTMRGCCPDPVVVPPPPPPVTAAVSICPTPACFTWGSTQYTNISDFVDDVKSLVLGAAYNPTTCTFSAPAGSVFPDLTIVACVPVVVPPVYCPSFYLDTCGCNEVGYAYRDNALRDPAATVAIVDCLGDTAAWIYPAAGVTGTVRHEVPYYENNVLLGYAANQSDCAPPVRANTTVNVAAPAVTTNVAAPVVNVAAPVTNVAAPTVNVAAPSVTLPAPTLVATAVSPTGVVTNTLSNGNTVVSNEPAANC
jgi:hypothetical protein